MASSSKRRPHGEIGNAYSQSLAWVELVAMSLALSQTRGHIIIIIILLLLFLALFAWVYRGNLTIAQYIPLIYGEIKINNKIK